MLALKVPLKDAERARKDIVERGLFQQGYKAVKEDGHLYLPVKERFDTSYEFEERDLPGQQERPKSLREALEGKLSPEVLERLKTAYDQVGDIAILEVDEDLKQYDEVIGVTLLETNPRVSTVLAKDASHEGTYRTQKMRLLAGEDKRVTFHKENGVTLEVDVEDVYFSVRLSTERKRIMNLMEPGERVLVMFSGCGPYTCVLSKNTRASEVVGVEINPRGHELARKNIRRNKLSNATTHVGDAREVVPTLVTEKGGFDRILMPLPKGAETFLDVALKAANDTATIHLYTFLHEDEVDKAYTWIREACEAASVGCDVRETVRCGQQAPHVYRYCVDFVTNK